MMKGKTTQIRGHRDPRGKRIAARGACGEEHPRIERALTAFNEADSVLLVEDAIGKYRRPFRHGHVLEISKTDLARHVPFSIPNATRDAFCVQPELYVLAISTLTSDGGETWCELSSQRRTALLDVGDASPTECGCAS